MKNKASYGVDILDRKSSGDERGWTVLLMGWWEVRLAGWEGTCGELLVAGRTVDILDRKSWHAMEAKR